MNPKRISTYILLAASTVIAALSSCRNQEPLYVDVNLLVNGYEGMKEARKEFQQQERLLQADADSILGLWKNELTKYEKERSGMSAKERQAREELLDMKGQQVSGVMEATKRKIAEKEQEQTAQVLAQVNDFIKRYGKEKKHRLILGANGSGNILYAPEELNITDEVLEALNKEYEEGR